MKKDNEECRLMAAEKATLGEQVWQKFLKGGKCGFIFQK